MNFCRQNLLLALFAAISVISCGRASEEAADLSFEVLGIPGIIQKVNNPQVIACVDNPQRSQEVQNALSTWLRAAGSTAQAVVNSMGSGNCDVTVQYRNMGGSRSYTMVQSGRAEVHMNDASAWMSSNGTLMHEFGHVFGLGDTYEPTRAQSGVCISGQPRQAIMCTPSLGVPQQDDIQGLHAVMQQFGVRSNGAGTMVNPNNFDSSNFGNTGQQNDLINNNSNNGILNNSNSLGQNNSINNINTINSNQNSNSYTQTQQSNQLMGVLAGFIAIMASNQLDASNRQITSNSETKNTSTSIPKNIDYKKCKSLIDTYIIKKDTKVVLGVKSKFKALNLTACLGDFKTCADPHAPRYLMERKGKGSENKIVYVSESLKKSDEDKLREDDSQTIVLDGSFVNSEGAYKAFRCEGPAEKP